MSLERFESMIRRLEAGEYGYPTDLETEYMSGAAGPTEDERARERANQAERLQDHIRGILWSPAAWERSRDLIERLRAVVRREQAQHHLI